MLTSQSALARLYLFAVLLGILSGAVYDLLRITRILCGEHYSAALSTRLQQLPLPHLPPKKEKKHRLPMAVLTAAEDFFFALFGGISFILLSYEYNNGKIRIPALLCSTVGFFLWRGTLGHAVMLFSEAIAFFLDAALRYLWLALTFPIKLCAKRCRRAVGSLAKKIGSARRRRARSRYTQRLENDLPFLCDSTFFDGKRRSEVFFGSFRDEKKEDVHGEQQKKSRTGKRAEKAIQPEPCHAHSDRRYRSRLHRHLRKRDHAVQPAQRGNGSFGGAVDRADTHTG